MKNAGKTFEQRMYDINHSKNLPMTFEYLSKKGTQIRFQTAKDIKNSWGFKLDKNNQHIPSRTMNKLINNCKWKIISGGYDENGKLISTITTIEII
jgi:ABC-type oligopeptide transport system substrate-binding subunit